MLCADIAQWRLLGRLGMMVYKAALLGHAPRAVVTVVMAYPQRSHAKVGKGSFL